MESNRRLKIVLEGLGNGVTKTCLKYNISRTIYYRWLKRYKYHGIDGLKDIEKKFTPANKTSPEIESALINLIHKYPHYGPKALKYLLDEVGYRISESAVYNIMKRHNLTKKEMRLKFVSNTGDVIDIAPPTFDTINSGECWLFWITDYGPHDGIPNLYEYTFYDMKSHIACTRLYDSISLVNFDNLLNAVAIPVATTLHLSINYLCFFYDDKLLKKQGKTFKAKLNQILLDSGFHINIHILVSDSHDFTCLQNLRAKYTQGCLSFLLPLINKGMSFAELKKEFQDYLRDYNLEIPSIFDSGEYSPVSYHNKLTKTTLILPIWAYMGRDY